MEILSTEEVNFITGMIIYGVAALLFFILTIVIANDGHWGLAIFPLLLGMLFLSVSMYAGKAEPHHRYKAIVTDFNEVYDNGYKIIGREGDLWILEEEEWD